MALIAGDADKARAIAGKLVKSLSRDAEDYWPLATLAEALLISGDAAKAKTVLAKARSARGGDDGAKASTILQFRRLAEVLGTDMEAFVDELGARNVAVFSGHLFRGKELDEAAQETTEAEIRRRAEALFKTHNVGIVYGALAAGTDIILAETALKLGAELDIVLPFATERFIETSVRIGDPPGFAGKWEKRFRAVLDGSQGARSLTIMDPTDPADRDLDSYFFYAFRYAAGCALQRAGVLQTRCRLVVVSDDGEPDTIAGTNRAIADWRAQGRALDVIPYPHRAPAADSEAEQRERAFAPSCFSGTRRQTARTPKPCSINLPSWPARDCKRIDRTHRDGRLGACLIAGSTEEALAAGAALADAARKAKQALTRHCRFRTCAGRRISSLTRSSSCACNRPTICRGCRSIACWRRKPSPRKPSSISARRSCWCRWVAPRSRRRRRTANGRPCAAARRCRSIRPNGPKVARPSLRKFKAAAGCSGLDGARLA